ncbi:bacterio-opsin activator domain-containing protein [Natrialbaceae archaeon AArc-T1-2]|uniref:bacterio-opsin activator domain-containing protein n=1 Tax=Natrialbaceae archaeon AArc-T1-2 TaxID=3053904 RepID=UPI00255B0BD5|nr:bacterio-opsin activator domain-containing protein [Natrialbaceae archaeon AArc-T1-2]WIV67571.1 bacterio-opsin activator domain-containing protein [Natrialbaceae archaeon AArc-T1-2]
MTDAENKGDRTWQTSDDREIVVAVLAPSDCDVESVDRLTDSPRFDVHRPDPDAIDRTVAPETDCLVVAADCPTVARELLEDVEAVEDDDAVDSPVVVAPGEGSEQLAAVAIRRGAADYVPPSDEATLADRIVTVADEHDDAADDERSRFRDLLAERLPDEAFLIDEDGYYLEATVRPESDDLYTVSADELVDHHLSDAFPADVAADLQACLDRTLETEEVQSIEYEVETTEGRRWYEARVVPFDETIDGRRVVVWLGRDITERVERERTLRRQRDQFVTLNDINRVVRQVIHTLVEAPTREAIEREACRQLVESELYTGSWIGELDGDDIVVRTAAGETTALFEFAREQSSWDGEPVLETLETGVVRTSNRMADEPRISERVRRAAREDDVRSAITIPIEHDTTSYGALVVYASRDDAFSPREEDAFRLLGETIGFAITAVKNRRLLFADTVVELEVRVEHGDSLSFYLSEEYDCTCSLEWIGETARGKIYQYVTVEGLDGETVMAEASDHDSVAECRLVHDGADQCTIELRLHESGARTLANYGATIRDITVEDGIAMVLLEVPHDADVRELIDALRSVYDDVTLTARREVGRPVHTAEERRERIVDRLTDRQLTALRFAYHGGYFDWPRASTGEELAEAMDVSPPTMHQHLRKALNEVLAEFFEESGTDVE